MRAQTPPLGCCVIFRVVRSRSFAYSCVSAEGVADCTLWA